MEDWDIDVWSLIYPSPVKFSNHCATPDQVFKTRYEFY